MVPGNPGSTTVSPHVQHDRLHNRLSNTSPAVNQQIMPTLHFLLPEGGQHTVQSDADSVMEAALEHAIPGIDADCGGVCSCATCHVVVHPDWQSKVGPATDAEQEILRFEDDIQPASRLSCQIPLTADLDGLIVEVRPLR